MLPPGMPPTANVVSITRKTSDPSCAGDSATPYSRARKGYGE
jgi:hypothetical protein